MKKLYRIYSVFFVLFFLINVGICFSIDVPNKLIFAQVIWRHGDRAPVSNYPKDPNNEDKWTYGWGELTQLGMEQQLALGQLLRKRYILQKQLLDERYNPKQIYVRSTDVNRTLLSAMSNLAGMFPAGEPSQDFPNTTNWPSKWTPIPVHTVPESTDYIGNVFAYCPRAKQLRLLIEEDPGFQAVAKENRRFFEYISMMSGYDYNLNNIFELNDIIYCEMTHNISQPQWVSRSVIAQLRNLTQIATHYYLGIAKPYLPELIRLRGGNLLKALIEKMKLKIGCVQSVGGHSGCQWYKNLKYYAYSAHDTTLAALLSTFTDEETVIPGGLPHYTASLAVELWQTKENGPSVKILYHSSSNHDYHVITDLAKGCPKSQKFCPLETFERRSQKFIPQNIQKECRAKL